MDKEFTNSMLFIQSIHNNIIYNLIFFNNIYLNIFLYVLF